MSEDAIEAVALVLHDHRFGARDQSAGSWAISRRAARLAIEAFLIEVAS